MQGRKSVHAMPGYEGGPSIRKRLSLDATLSMADMDLPVPAQDLISSAVSFSPLLHHRLRPTVPCSVLPSCTMFSPLLRHTYDCRLARKCSRFGHMHALWLSRWTQVWKEMQLWQALQCHS